MLFQKLKQRTGDRHGDIYSFSISVMKNTRGCKLKGTEPLTNGSKMKLLQITHCNVQEKRWCIPKQQTKVERVAVCATNTLQTLIKYGQRLPYYLLDFSDYTICWKCTSALYTKWIVCTLKANLRNPQGRSWLTLSSAHEFVSPVPHVWVTLSYWCNIL